MMKMARSLPRANSSHAMPPFSPPPPRRQHSFILHLDIDAIVGETCSLGYIDDHMVDDGMLFITVHVTQ